MKVSKRKRIRRAAKERRVLTPRDVAPYGISRRDLSRMCHQGQLSRVARGLYTLPDTEASENRTIAEVAKRVHGGVICLLSALRFHGLTTQLPHRVWVAIDRKARLPKEPRLPMRVVRFSGRALESGVEKHRIEGVEVKVYNPAKTVTDCFKYRNKIGLEVALEALRDCRRMRKCTIDELWLYAKVCRVKTVMRPYLESVV